MPNRLAREKSPYLKAHADDPVDWWPWGPEAFRKARREGKPIFLSIGYSSCHWCHVMARESFRDPEVARLLNESFVPVKVDREERPDVDAVYMAACQGLTGGGGWPLTLLLTPDAKPFFAATYLPKEGRFGRPGLKELLERVRALWRDPEGRRALLEQAERIHRALAERLRSPSPSAPLSPNQGPDAAPDPDEGPLRRAYEALAQSFDAEHGGFGRAPKFPLPHRLSFLLRAWKRFREPFALEMVEKTLQAIRRGGVYDAVGFGVHRYATDRAWRLPHFEKMLYDQALLALAYLEAYQATGRALYAQTARELFEYVLRDLHSPEGGFYSAEDAESEGEEGKFYTWRYDELEALLEPEELRLVERAFGVRPEGNYAEEATGRPTGRNVLAQTAPWTEVARALGLSLETALECWAHAHQRLFGARARRPRPARDEKVLTDWNGLMIAALARGARALAEPAYAEAAERAAHFVRGRLVVGGELRHRYGDGEAAVPAFLDDYAFLAWGLLELYEATLQLEHLEWALELVEEALARFWDEGDGGCFFTARAHHAPEGAAAPPLRLKTFEDGAVPSGNGVLAGVLLKLARLTGRPELETRAQALFRAANALLAGAPSACPQLLSALDFALGPTAELVLVGRRDDPQLAALRQAAEEGFHPRLSVLLKPEDEDAFETIRKLEALAPFTRELKSPGNRATAHLCRSFVCEAPLMEPEVLRARLEDV